jgi:hypothetical protein
MPHQNLASGTANAAPAQDGGILVFSSSHSGFLTHIGVTAKVGEDGQAPDLRQTRSRPGSSQQERAWEFVDKLARIGVFEASQHPFWSAINGRIADAGVAVGLAPLFAAVPIAGPLARARGGTRRARRMLSCLHA